MEGGSADRSADLRTDPGTDSGSFSPWSPRSALGLVAMAFALSLLAGAVVAAIGETGWASAARALAAGGILLGMYGVLLAIVWGSTAIRGARFADAVGFQKAPGARWYAAGLGAALLGWLFSVGFIALLTACGMDAPREDLAVFRVLPGGPLGVTLTVLLLVVIAPIAEEVVYRGVLLSALTDRWGPLVGLAVSAVVFSAVHLSPVGFVPLAVAGVLFGWLYMKSRSLWVALVAHAAYNALGVLALFASKTSGLL